MLNITNYIVLLETESSLLSPDQFAGYAVTALCTIINLLVAYFVLKFFVFKPILKIIKAREEKIKAEVEETTKLNEEAKASLGESKKLIEDARIEASQIIEDAKNDATNQANMIVSKANEEAQAILLRTDDEVKKIRRTALEEVKDEVSDLAVEVSTKVIGDIASRDELTKLSVKYTNEILDSEVSKIDEKR